MVEFNILTNFLVALALGALVGLEREYALAQEKVKGFAGIRTFPLIALFGALAAYFGQIISPWILLASLVALVILTAVAYYLSSEEKFHGITSSIASFIVFFIGILCAYEEIILAIIVAVSLTLLLYGRAHLHRFAKKIKREELVDTIKFIIIAFVVLPFLPNQGYGPYEMFNPFVIWLMVVFISGISFAGYILMKWLGGKGLALTGIFGGLVSSTAVTSSFANRSKKEGKVVYALALGVILANAVMFFRILIVVFALNRSLIWDLLLPMGALALVSVAFAYFLFKKAKQIKKHKLELTSPFTLWPALKFGVFFAVVLALVKIADVYLSSKGVYLVSLISGFADVDAITISLSQLAKKDLAENIARNGIILAALTNVVVKGGIAYLFGSKKFGRIVLSLFLALILIGVGTIFLF